MKNNQNEPQTANDQHTVTFTNFKPTGGTGDQGVTVITSTYEEAEAWGAMPVSDEELKENLGLDTNKED